MAALSVLLNSILPVFAIIVIGYVMGRGRRVSADEARLINKFAMTVLMPCLIFDLVANAPIYDFALPPLAAYVSVEVLLFGIGFLIARRWMRRSPQESFLLAFAAIFSNTVLYILPISILIHGKDGILPITAIISVDASIVFGGAMMALQMMNDGKVTPLSVIMTVVRTPLLPAIGLGVVFALWQIPIPQPVQTFLAFNGAGAPPAALFALGVVLAQTPVRFTAPVAVFGGLKLLAFPAVLGAILVSGGMLDGDAMLYMLASAGPSGAMAFSLAMLYGVRTESIAQVILWTSVVSLIPLALVA
ncbi:MAG: AEC family transporter [Paracoccaceae bacterium]